MPEVLPQAVILRNEVLPTKIPAKGLVIVRDGESGDREFTLSPPLCHYQHHAEVELFVQHADAHERDTTLDALLQALGRCLEKDFTLGGAVDFLYVGAPEVLTEATEGAPPIKAFLVPVNLEYSTSFF